MYRRIRAGRRSDQGFTLIELLVVIIILGILAAVVVFAVSGVGDRGKAASVATDAKTIRTAEEAYCAQNGRYASGADLVAGGFLSEVPTYHQVDARFSGEGSCNGWQFNILREEAAGPYEIGRWDVITPPDLGMAFFTVRLADGRVLAAGINTDFNSPAAQIWDPTTGAWEEQDVPPYPVGGSESLSHSALLLRDDPATPQSECRGVVDNCGKVFVYGKYLFDPTKPVGANQQWEVLTPPSTAVINNNGTRAFALSRLTGSPDQCGNNCGKIAMFFGQVIACGPVAISCDRFDLFDPTTNGYSESPSYPDLSTALLAFSSYAMPAPDGDGRVFFCCTGADTTVPTAAFLDPLSLTFSSSSLPTLAETYSRSHLESHAVTVLPTGEFYLGFNYENWDPMGRSTGVYKAEPGGTGSLRTLPSCVPENETSDEVPAMCLTFSALLDGRILVARSAYPDQLNSYTILVFNPATSSWSEQPPLNDTLSYGSPPLLLDPARGPCASHCGKVLLIGQGSAELYTP